MRCSNGIASGRRSTGRSLAGKAGPRLDEVVIESGQSDVQSEPGKLSTPSSCRQQPNYTARCRRVSGSPRVQAVGDGVGCDQGVGDAVAASAVLDDDGPHAVARTGGRLTTTSDYVADGDSAATWLAPGRRAQHRCHVV
jgi:hypothetical protein